MSKLNQVATKMPDVAHPSTDSSMQVALLEIVKRKDIDPERLEKFLDLQIKMEARQAEREFNAALAGFQGECPIISKTKNVRFTARSGKETNYDYSPIEEIVGQIKPLLSKYQLSFSFNIKELGDKDKMELLIKIRHASGHCEETSYFFNKYHDDERMNLSQRAKASTTFAKRAGLENALGIVTEKEKDADDPPNLPEVTPEQVAEIKSLLKETNSDEAKFLIFIKADSLDSLNPEQTQKALHALKQKAKKE